MQSLIPGTMNCIQTNTEIQTTKEESCSPFHILSRLWPDNCSVHPLFAQTSCSFLPLQKYKHHLSENLPVRKKLSDDFASTDWQRMFHEYYLYPQRKKEHTSSSYCPNKLFPVCQVAAYYSSRNTA